MDNTPTTLGDLLAHLRRRAGLDMPDVIERLQAARSTAYGWERNPLGQPSVHRLQQLLNLYGATPEERLQAWDLRASSASAVVASSS